MARFVLTFSLSVVLTMLRCDPSQFNFLSPFSLSVLELRRPMIAFDSSILALIPQLQLQVMRRSSAGERNARIIYDIRDSTALQSRGDQWGEGLMIDIDK
ncbi:hypothetical protein DEU56DRAFT_816683 [Suillus clintonianus]|uniref:uncharacterized protein n=1 Tax=Suillus clintonianus TaxID=1904413 RepID=UPI001B86F6D3|nr:uncharacterized protein DEU56DRAFT_816683 [Suillus clintonianus]KAG2129786.1 hypothetical protein DEU56DRAFT_816683 [Suillus clintonianus]